MRVLFVNENVGGHRTVHHHLERHLAGRSDIEARFFHVGAAGLVRRAVGASLPLLGALDLDLQPLRAQLALSAVVRRRLIRELGDVDAVHVYTHNAALLSADLLRRVPSVVTLDTTNADNAFRLPYRSPTRWTARTLPLAQLFERRVYRAATRVVANSEWAARSLRSDYGVDESRLRVFPAGIEVPPLRREQPQAPLPRVTFVGKSLERKGGRLLIDLHQRHLRDRCVVTLVTQERVERLHGVEVIRDLAPGDERLWTILGRSSVFAFPSEIDMAPNAVLEAMAAGVPVVAFAVAALPEMVEDGVTGHLVELGDEHGFLHALVRLLDDPQRARAMGAAGRARVEALYDVRLFANRLVETLAEARDEHRTGVRGAGSREAAG